MVHREILQIHWAGSCHSNSGIYLHIKHLLYCLEKKSILGNTSFQIQINQVFKVKSYLLEQRISPVLGEILTKWLGTDNSCKFPVFALAKKVSGIQICFIKSEAWEPESTNLSDWLNARRGSFQNWRKYMSNVNSCKKRMC